MALYSVAIYLIPLFVAIVILTWKLFCSFSVPACSPKRCVR